MLNTGRRFVSELVAIVFLFTLVATPGCLPPDPTGETVSIKIEAGILVVNGTKVLPRGFYFWPDHSRSNGHHPLDDIQSAGGNMLVAYYPYIKPGMPAGGAQLNMKELTDGAIARKVYFFVGQPGFEMVRDMSEAQLTLELKKSFDEGKRTRYFLGFMLDEPPNANYTVEMAHKYVRAMRAAAPGRLLWVNFAPNQLSFWSESQTRQLGELADVVSGDLYPIPEGHCGSYTPQYPDCTLQDPGKMAGWLKTLFPSKARWFIQQANRWEEFTDDPPPGSRFPTWSETRFMTYDLLAQGVSGLFYFGIMHLGNQIPYDQPLFADHLPDLSDELQQMAPWITGGSTRTVTSSNPNAHVAAWTMSGQTLLIVTLASPNASQAVISIEGLSSGTVTDFFDATPFDGTPANLTLQLFGHQALALRIVH